MSEKSQIKQITNDALNNHEDCAVFVVRETEEGAYTEGYGNSNLMFVGVASFLAQEIEENKANRGEYLMDLISLVDKMIGENEHD